MDFLRSLILCSPFVLILSAPAFASNTTCADATAGLKYVASSYDGGAPPSRSMATASEQVWIDGAYFGRNDFTQANGWSAAFVANFVETTRFELARVEDKVNNIGTVTSAIKLTLRDRQGAQRFSDYVICRTKGALVAPP